MLAGAALKASVPATDLKDFQFDESIFFLVFLPYIIFEAGLTIDKRLLSDQLGPIALFSIAGTFLSIFCIGYLLFFGGEFLGSLPSSHNCLCTLLYHLEHCTVLKLHQRLASFQSSTFGK